MERAPQQRAVLLLRDVYELSVEETAQALGLSAPNVKTTHHRARRALEPYQRDRSEPRAALTAQNAEALRRFLGAISSGDVDAVKALFTEDIVFVSDGGGEYHASRKPMHGPLRVARMLVALQMHMSPPSRFAILMLNGVPTFVVERDRLKKGEAPRFAIQCAIDGGGRIKAVYSALATTKLARIQPLPPLG